MPNKTIRAPTLASCTGQLLTTFVAARSEDHELIGS
jgi:hypothetical protein